MEQLRRQWVTVRKDHQCFLSGEIIRKGSKAWLETYVDGGEIYALYVSPMAEAFVDKYKSELEDSDGELQEFVIINSMEETWNEFKSEYDVKI